MLRFKSFISESAETEASEDKSQNKRGVLHELLVGRALLGGAHMRQLPDRNGLAPSQVHDAYAEKIYGSSYEDHPSYRSQVARAGHAAEAIRSAIGNKPIHKIHWTSKPGDVAAITGNAEHQEKDSSDLYIDHGKEFKDPRERFTGVSLKSAEGKGDFVHISNTGREKEDAKLGVDTSDILRKSRKRLRAAHPGFRVAETGSQAAAVRNSDPEASKMEAAERSKVLSEIAKKHARAYSTMDRETLVDHLKTMMRAHDTGHGHIRVITSGQGEETNTRVQTPHLDHAHIFNDPNNIKVEAVKNSVVFKHKGKPFFRHRAKAASGAGVFGNIKFSGE